MFADDSVLLCSDKDPNSACVSMERDLVTLSDYFGKLKLMRNASKTKIMLFSKLIITLRLL